MLRARLCQNRGQRVQNSIFECLVDAAQWVAFRASLVDVVDAEEDSLRFYFLGNNWKGRVEHFIAEGNDDAPRVRYQSKSIVRNMEALEQH